jgi:hypothetical protein
MSVNMWRYCHNRGVSSMRHRFRVVTAPRAASQVVFTAHQKFYAILVAAVGESPMKMRPIPDNVCTIQLCIVLWHTQSESPKSNQ